ncbi:hypothetical protein Sste5344_001599 [Sporothrix stenoceras]
MGYYGAMGSMFVEERHRNRLVHETHVYRELSELQGRLITVHLGLIKLDMEYPMTEEELEVAGLVDKDENLNMMWCVDTQRVMRINCDHAYVTKHE